MEFNKEKLDEIFDEIKRKLDAMSQEEFEKEVLKLNGVMSDDLLDKVMKEVYDKGMIDSEDLAYKTKKEVKITAEEFNDVFHYIAEHAGSNKIKKDSCESPFIDNRLYFRYRGANFIWRELFGQGAVYQIYASEDTTWPEESPLVYKESESFEIIDADTSLRFYKTVCE